MAKAAGSKIGVKVLLAFLCSLMMQAQQIDTLSMTTESNSPLLGQLVVDGDTVPWSVLDEMLFVAKPTLSDFQARRNYYMLMKKVGRVYPYVREAALRMDSVNLQLEGIDRRRQRRKYTKSYQKYLEERFEPELRKLTRSEGQILSKLIYRETHTSVYEIIKTYRNGLSARFWSMTAWWYDIDLKRPYDPENDAEDRLIENILLRKFISGELVPARADERNIYLR
jgi:hypothetical protein|tara:strand:- start:407 stop:1081 length:675 start_codon:yes stop_codon:yes gene_type:complete